MSDVLNLSQTAREGVEILREVLIQAKHDWNSPKEVPFNVILSHFESYCVRHGLHHRLERRCFQAMLLFTADTSLRWAERMECLPLYFKQLRKDQILDISPARAIRRSVNVNDEDATSIAEYLNASTKRVTFSSNQSWSQSQIHPSTPATPHSTPLSSHSASLPPRALRRDIFLSHHSSPPSASAPAQPPPPQPPFSSAISPVPHISPIMPSPGCDMFLSPEISSKRLTPPASTPMVDPETHHASSPRHNFSPSLRLLPSRTSNVVYVDHSNDSTALTKSRFSRDASSQHSHNTSDSTTPDSPSIVETPLASHATRDTPSPRVLKNIKHVASQKHTARNISPVLSSHDSPNPSPASPISLESQPSPDTSSAPCISLSSDLTRINPIASTLRLLILFQRHISRQPFSIAGSLRNPSPALYVHLSSLNDELLSPQEEWLRTHVLSFVRLQTMDIYFRSWKDTIYSVSLATTHFQYFGKRRGFIAFEEFALLTRSRQNKTQWKCAWMWKIRMKIFFRSFRMHQQRNSEKRRQNSAIDKCYYSRLVHQYLNRWWSSARRSKFQYQAMQDGSLQQKSLVFSRLRRNTLIAKRYRTVRRKMSRKACKLILQNWLIATRTCKKLIASRENAVINLSERYLLSRTWKQLLIEYQKCHATTICQYHKACDQWEAVKLMLALRRWREYHTSAVSYFCAMQTKCSGSILPQSVFALKSFFNRRKLHFEKAFSMFRCIRQWRRRMTQFVKVYTDLRAVLNISSQRAISADAPIRLRTQVAMKLVPSTIPQGGVVYMCQMDSDPPLQLRTISMKDIKQYRKGSKMCQPNLHFNGYAISFIKRLVYQWHIKAVTSRWKRNQMAYLSKYIRLITAPSRAAVLHTPLFRRQLSRAESVSVLPCQYRWAVYNSYYRWKRRHTALRPIRAALTQATYTIIRGSLTKWWRNVKLRRDYKAIVQKRIKVVMMEWKIMYWMQKRKCQFLLRCFTFWKNQRIMQKYTSVWYKFLTQRDVRRGFNTWKYLTQAVLKCSERSMRSRGMVGLSLWTVKSRQTRENMQAGSTYNDFIRKNAGFRSLVEYTRLRQEENRQSMFLDEMVGFFALLNKLRSRVTNRQMESMARRYNIKRKCTSALHMWRRSVRRRVLHREKYQHAAVFCTARGATIAFNLLSSIS